MESISIMKPSIINVETKKVSSWEFKPVFFFLSCVVENHDMICGHRRLVCAHDLLDASSHEKRRHVLRMTSYSSMAENVEVCLPLDTLHVRE